MTNILSIDPGSIESAFVIWDGENILNYGKDENGEILYLLEKNNYDEVVIEQVRSYGMAVGASVFDTVWWSGRFYEAVCWAKELDKIFPVMMPRMEVKMHLCHSPRAKDTNIIQALVDRFAPNEKNRGKGKKASPGFFYGFHSDIWQAFALAVTFYDKNKGGL